MCARSLTGGLVERSRLPGGPFLLRIVPLRSAVACAAAAAACLAVMYLLSPPRALSCAAVLSVEVGFEVEDFALFALCAVAGCA